MPAVAWYTARSVSVPQLPATRAITIKVQALGCRYVAIQGPRRSGHVQIAVLGLTGYDLFVSRKLAPYGFEGFR